MLAAASGALINELQAGWPWWVAAALVVLAAAVLAGWIAAGDQSDRHSPPGGLPAESKPPGFSSIRIAPGGFFSGRNMKIRGNITTTSNSGTGVPRPRPGGAEPGLDVQGFYAGGDLNIGGDVDTTGGAGKP